MPIVRLIREVHAPDGHGPGNGQAALQKALRAIAPDWLKIGGAWQPGEIVWFWSWQDGPAAAGFARLGMPFICGPNILFEDSRRPCAAWYERPICTAQSCLLHFTESAWYRDLMRQHVRPGMRIVLWPYPIEPQPEGPLPADWDVLIYEKSGFPAFLPAEIAKAGLRVVRFRYGAYRRGDLIEAARRSRCCLYLSDDDRGPLALAEVMLAGCPAVGVPRGAPWIEQDKSGRCVENLHDHRAIVEAIHECRFLDRHDVRACAQTRFDTGRTVRTILDALETTCGIGRQTATVPTSD